MVGYTQHTTIVERSPTTVIDNWRNRRRVLWTVLLAVLSLMGFVTHQTYEAQTPSPMAMLVVSQGYYTLWIILGFYIFGASIEDLTSIVKTGRFSMAAAALPPDHTSTPQVVVNATQ